MANRQWRLSLDLCGELASVDPSSVPARSHREDATRNLQAELADKIFSAWKNRNLDTTESLLLEYVQEWRQPTEELMHVQHCLDMERFLANAATSLSKAQAQAGKEKYGAAVSTLDAIPKAPAPPEDSYTSKLASAMGSANKLRQEALDDWITTIEQKVHTACSGNAKTFKRVDSIIAETNKIPLNDKEKKKLQARLRKQSVKERCKALETALKAAGEARDWQLMVSLCADLEAHNPSTPAGPAYRKHASDGMRLDSGILEAVRRYREGRYVECASFCDEVVKEHGASELRFDVKHFKGTLPELKEAARKSEAEFLAAVEGIRKAADSCDWDGVSRWAHAARKLKRKDSTVEALIKEAHKKRAQIRRSTTFRIIRRAAAVFVLCSLAFFIFHYARLWHVYDSSLKAADEVAAFEAAQKVEWFYGPAAHFISAHEERALLKTAQLAATGILGHIYDSNWLAAQKILSEGQSAWAAREFGTAQKQWSLARTYCQRISRSAIPITISLSPLLRDATVRLAGSDNEQLAVQRGAQLDLKATPGIYQMDVEHPDYEPLHDEFVVDTEAGDLVRVHAELTPLPGTLIVQCQPSASVLLDGDLLGDSGELLSLAAGKHDIEVYAEHHETETRTVLVAPNGEAGLNLELQPLPRKLIAKCDPVATVVLDGQPIGKTGEDLTIPVGNYKITLMANGYKSKSFNANVRPGRNVTIDTTLEFIPLPGKLLLSCTPTAQVYADGLLVGNTDKPLALTEGKHRVELVAAGYIKKVLTVAIPLGKDVEWSGALTPAPGIFHVSATVPLDYGRPTKPLKAILTLDGKSKAITFPYTDKTMAPGTYVVDVNIVGYEPIPKRTVTIKSGESTRFPLLAVPQSATITFLSAPPDAAMRVYVKEWRRGVKRDKLVGVGGEAVDLMPFVKHEVVFKAKGYSQTSRSISLPNPGRAHGEVTINLTKTSRWR
jgi:hypothetical protein